MIFFKPKKPQLPADNSQPILALPLEWPYRLLGSLSVLFVLFIVSFLVYVANSDWLSHRKEDIRRAFYAKTSKWGFTVDDVVVIGRNHTSMKDINEMTNIRRQDNILAIDLAFLKNNLEALPWIKKVSLKRLYFPNIIQINITEKKVKALWQLNNQFYPIDDDGKIIDARYLPKQPTLLIVGEEAPQNINKLLQDIGQNEEILKRVKVANYISRRRWNLTLDNIENGITIKLPEKNVKKAWKKLLKLNTTNGILKRKLTIIDLRLSGKVIVKLKKSHSRIRKSRERRM